MTITYEDVAAGLPVDVREAIELSLPCRVAADGGHMWAPEYRAYTDLRWWECCHCGVTSCRDPRPLDSFARRRQWDLPNTYEITRMFSR